jgi:predicted RNA-binding protein
MGNNETELNITKRTKETKRASFLKLAEKRTNNALKSLDLIANLSNKYYYEYSEEQIVKIFNALKERLSDAEDAFNKASGDSKEEFKL